MRSTATDAAVAAMQFIHTAVPEHLAGAVLNGALVGLCCEDTQRSTTPAGAPHHRRLCLPPTAQIPALSFRCGRSMMVKSQQPECSRLL